MRAIVQTAAGSPSVFQLKHLPKPTPVTPTDIVVKVKAFAFNPIDYKKRNMEPEHEDFIVGWDASGLVEEIGSGVTKFQVGDEVFFAGSLARNGSYAEYTVVDERLVALKPRNWDHIKAASVPLVSLTAWESLGEKLGLGVDPKGNRSKSILIVNGAGGVGSMAIQLSVKYFGVGTVIATASRPETAEWAKNLGATFVIDHRNDFAEELKGINVEAVDYVLLCHDGGIERAVAVTKPFGHIVSIVPSPTPLKFIDDAFVKSLTFSWTFMFTKSLLGVAQESQGEILTTVARLIEEGVVEDIVTSAEPFSLDNVRNAHVILESSKAIGKKVIYFQQ